MARLIKMNGNAEEVTIKLKEIKDINKEVDMGSWKKKLPFELKYSVPTLKSSVTAETMQTLKTDNWNKKFYVKNDQVRFTRENDLLALVEIFKAKKDKDILRAVETGEMDIDLFIGKEFDGVVVEINNPEDEDEKLLIIDWVGTFMANGVKVPTPEELGHKQTSVMEELDPDNDDEDELPIED